ncbi:hypothetical protein COOONC_16966 [Cooperia oncophora]
MDDDASVLELLRKKEELLRLLQEAGDDDDEEEEDEEEDEYEYRESSSDDEDDEVGDEDDDDYDVEGEDDKTRGESPSPKRPRLDEAVENGCPASTSLAGDQWKSVNGMACPVSQASVSAVHRERSESCSQKALEEDQDLEYEDDLYDDGVDVHDILEEAVDKIKKEAEESEPIPNYVDGEKGTSERLKHCTHFMNLPEGWARITHNSGMPVYLHRKTRVISLAKPYFIGTQGVRDHRIPVTGVPCLHQRKVLERDAALAKEAEKQKNIATESALESEIKQKLNRSCRGRLRFVAFNR